MSGWLLLHVYVLVDFLNFVDLLFRSGVFKYVLFCGGWGARCVYLQKVFVYVAELFRGGKNEGARDVWDFQPSASRLLSSMV